MFEIWLALSLALCIGIEIGVTLHRRRRRPRVHVHAARDIVIVLLRENGRRFSNLERSNTMFTKGSILIIAALAVLADKVTPGALQTGTGITLTPDNPNLGTLEQLDAGTFKYTFTDFGTVNFHATATNSDGAAIGSSQDASATATDQAAVDIVLTVTAAPVVAAPADTGTAAAT